MMKTGFVCSLYESGCLEGEDELSAVGVRVGGCVFCGEVAFHLDISEIACADLSHRAGPTASTGPASSTVGLASSPALIRSLGLAALSAGPARSSGSGRSGRSGRRASPENDTPQQAEGEEELEGYHPSSALPPHPNPSRSFAALPRSPPFHCPALRPTQGAINSDRMVNHEAFLRSTLLAVTSLQQLRGGLHRSSPRPITHVLFIAPQLVKPRIPSYGDDTVRHLVRIWVIHSNDPHVPGVGHSNK